MFSHSKSVRDKKTDFHSKGMRLQMLINFEKNKNIVCIPGCSFSLFQTPPIFTSDGLTTESNDPNSWF
jgi:hypothetical protein